jgi:hypothetical protein
MSLERSGCLASPEVGVVVIEGLGAEPDVDLGGVACVEVGVVTLGVCSVVRLGETVGLMGTGFSRTVVVPR